VDAAESRHVRDVRRALFLQMLLDAVSKTRTILQLVKAGCLSNWPLLTESWTPTVSRVGNSAHKDSAHANLDPVYSCETILMLLFGF
jgi:hypothetical protein